MGGPAPRAVRFVAAHPGSEGVAMRIGAHNAELVLISKSGAWVRTVVASTEAAHSFGAQLGVPVNDGWTDDLRRRVTQWRRSTKGWRRAPYPERVREWLAGS
ncbi:MAG TPA: hypothetical protein VKY26_02430 [Actinomycetota bacterium]|nr:hypothetical protein [Actinomycetota bacterium]